MIANEKGASQPPRDPADVLARSIQHLDMALSIADVQGSEVTVEKALLRAVLGAAKSLGPLCDVANAGDVASTAWAQILQGGVVNYSGITVAARMNEVMLALGKKLFDALPDAQRKAVMGAAVATDVHGNLMEDFNGKPIEMDATGLARLDKVAVSPIGDLVNKGERILKLMVLEYEPLLLRDIDPGSIATALNDLRIAIERMVPWKLRTPQ